MWELVWEGIDKILDKKLLQQYLHIMIGLSATPLRQRTICAPRHPTPPNIENFANLTLTNPKRCVL